MQNLQNFIAQSTLNTVLDDSLLLFKNESALLLTHM